MKKVLLFVLLTFYTFDLYALKLCKISCSYASQLDTWRTASGTIGTYTSTSGPSGNFWTLSVTSSPTGAVVGQSGCFSSGSSATGSGQYCWCRMTGVNMGSGDNPLCVGGWVFLYSGNDCALDCANGCGSCAQSGSSGSCSRSALFSIREEPAVTCPISGTCDSTSLYETIADSESCETGYEETTGPTLTVSGSYSNANGTFTYGTCTVN